MSKTFEAPASIPGYDTPIDLRKDKTKERDIKSLCGSKHAVWIGIQPQPIGGPNKIIPFENSIVVAFWANDTSGGGILDPAAVIGGIGTMIVDPQEYEKTVKSGLDIVNQNYQDCAEEHGGWNCKGEFTEAAAYTSAYIVTAPVRVVAAVGNWMFEDSVKTIWAKSPTVNKIKNWSIWGSEQSFAATDYLGLDYHSAGAMAHKVSVKITCRENGVTRVVHDTELAGTSEVYDGNKPLPSLGYFVIDSPGEWKVRVKSMASGGCADPRLDIIETFTVKPPTNSASSAENIARQIVGPGNSSRKVSKDSIIVAASENKESMYISPPVVGLLASAVFYGLYRYFEKP